MWAAVNRGVKACHECQKAKATRPDNRVFLKLPEADTHPFQRVSFDLLGPFPSSYSNNKWCLTVIDNFSNWPILIPLPDKEARTIADALLTKVIMEYGAFQQLHCDRENTLAAPVKS